jgi:hypothetical protein
MCACFHECLSGWQDMQWKKDAVVSNEGTERKKHYKGWGEHKVRCRQKDEAIATAT